MFETVLQNTSGKTRVFSAFGNFLLDDGNMFTVPGEVTAWLTAKYPGIKGRRMIRNFVDALDAGDIRVVSGPTIPYGGIVESSSSSSIGD